ncbi:21631_t:CDS:2 [Entrophospora sp. SA101]|nr:21631_t:CDS:2 [Entrophospora sp. SA101]
MFPGVVKSNDINTQEIGRALSDLISKRFKGLKPYLLVNHLGRSKIDVNRPMNEGTEVVKGVKNQDFIDYTKKNINAGVDVNYTNGINEGFNQTFESETQIVWNDYHTFMKSAVEEIEERFNYGIVIDLHGHGHPENYIELGYVLSSEILSLPRLKNQELEKVALEHTLTNETKIQWKRFAFLGDRIINYKVSKILILKQTLDFKRIASAYPDLISRRYLASIALKSNLVEMVNEKKKKIVKAGKKTVLDKSGVNFWAELVEVYMCCLYTEGNNEAIDDFANQIIDDYFRKIKEMKEKQQKAAALVDEYYNHDYSKIFKSKQLDKAEQTSKEVRKIIEKLWYLINITINVSKYFTTDPTPF